MPRKRIVARQEVERRVQALGGHLPRDERAGSEVGRHERLPDAADRPGLEHGADALEHEVERRVRQPGDLGEGILEKAGDAILGDGEDARVHGVGDFGGDRGACRGRRHAEL